MKTRLVWGLALAGLLGVMVAAGPPAAVSEPVKVVYHLNEGLDQARQAMANLRNHLAADPGVKIVVVAHGAGIDFLLKDAKDAQGAAFSNDLDELSLQGVEFRVCRNTLETHKIEPSRVVPEAKIVPSGVAEIARLQAKKGFVYLKP